MMNKTVVCILAVALLVCHRCSAQTCAPEDTTAGISEDLKVKCDDNNPEPYMKAANAVREAGKRCTDAIEKAIKLRDRLEEEAFVTTATADTKRAEAALQKATEHMKNIQNKKTEAAEKLNSITTAVKNAKEKFKVFEEAMKKSESVTNARREVEKLDADVKTLKNEVILVNSGGFLCAPKHGQTEGVENAVKALCRLSKDNRTTEDQHAKTHNEADAKIAKKTADEIKTYAEEAERIEKELLQRSEEVATAATKKPVTKAATKEEDKTTGAGPSKSDGKEPDNTAQSSNESSTLLPEGAVTALTRAADTSSLPQAMVLAVALAIALIQ